MRGSLAWGLAAGALALGGCKDEEPSGDAGGTGDEAGVTTSGSGGVDGESSGGSSGPGIDPAPPTWYQDIAPTMVAKCGGCHRPGGIAPFSLTDYESAAPYALASAIAVENHDMPPFAADDTAECEMNHGWKDDLRLSDEETLALRAWADALAPEGDAETAAPVAQPPSVDLTTVDQHLQLQEAVTIAGGVNDQFLCFSLDPGLTEDRYLQAMQIVPGNEKIVHHVLIYVDAEGESATAAGEDGWFECSGGSIGGDLIGAWAPGAVPSRTPEGAGMLVPAGARLVMNVHYHPSTVGDETDATTAIDIDWLDEVPVWRAQYALVGNGDGLVAGPNDENGIEFRIPPGVTDHTETMLVTLPSDLPELRLWSVGSHMHYVGVDMLIGVQRETSPGPDQECLLHTPYYSFEWQRLYTYDHTLDDAIRLAGGDKLYMRCIYDNTLGNAGVAEALGQQGFDEPIEVRLGEETLDEMCLGVYGIAFPNLF